MKLYEKHLTPDRYRIPKLVPTKKYEKFFEKFLQIVSVWKNEIFYITSLCWFMCVINIFKVFTNLLKWQDNGKYNKNGTKISFTSYIVSVKYSYVLELSIFLSKF